MFTSEPLHSLHRGISTMVRESALDNLLSDMLRNGGQRGERLFVKIRARVLRGSNLLHRALEEMGSCLVLV